MSTFFYGIFANALFRMRCPSSENFEPALHFSNRVSSSLSALGKYLCKLNRAIKEREYIHTKKADNMAPFQTIH